MSFPLDLTLVRQESGVNEDFLDRGRNGVSLGFIERSPGHDHDTHGLAERKGLRIGRDKRCDCLEQRRGIRGRAVCARPRVMANRWRTINDEVAEHVTSLPLALAATAWRQKPPRRYARLVSAIEQYSARALRQRAFAFDGTVVGIETRVDSKHPDGDQERSWVTFQVHRWFRGGTADEVPIWFDGRREFGLDPGVRLLVSGQPRWGGAPLDNPIAWPGAFTRPWDKGTADEWAAAFDA